MLRAVNRQVLEVNQTESVYFERILFIVKPEFSSLPLSKLMKEAQALTAGTTPLPPQMKRRFFGKRINR